MSKRKPKRIQWTRYMGPYPPDVVPITRGSGWGNHVARPAEKTPEAHAAAVALFREWLLSEAAKAYRVLIRRHLRGCDLACTCRQDLPCHGDVLLEVANSKEPKR